MNKTIKQSNKRIAKFGKKFMKFISFFEKICEQMTAEVVILEELKKDKIAAKQRIIALVESRHADTIHDIDYSINTAKAMKKRVEKFL